MHEHELYYWDVFLLNVLMILFCEYFGIFKTVLYVLNMISVLFHAYNEDWYRWM